MAQPRRVPIAVAEQHVVQENASDEARQAVFLRHPDAPVQLNSGRRGRADPRGESAFKGRDHPGPFVRAGAIKHQRRAACEGRQMLHLMSDIDHIVLYD